jgi:hypothetical protein
MRKILNQKVQAYIFLVDVKFEYKEKVYRVSCDYYSDSGVENLDVHEGHKYLSPHIHSNLQIYSEARDIVYDMNIKNT